LIAGAGRLGILAKLFRLVALNLPVPMIGSGRNRYQMIAVEDCVAAALRAVDCGLPAGPFNLGSAEPPTVRQLLEDLIARAGSRSILVPTPAASVQATLGLLDRAGLTLLYPEQFAIADSDYTLDTQSTTMALGWSPARRDEDIIFDAFCHFRQLDGAGPAIPAMAASSAE
jgi:dTDP-glucose 4,6-dehydratase